MYTVLSGSYFTLLKILLQASKSPVKDCKQREGNFAVLNLSLEPALLRPQVGTESLPCCVVTGSAYHYSRDRTDGRIAMVLAPYKGPDSVGPGESIKPNVLKDLDNESGRRIRKHYKAYYPVNWNELDLKIIHCPHVSLSQIFGRPGKDPVVLKDKKAHAKELDEQTLPLAEHKNSVRGDGFDYNSSAYRRSGLGRGGQWFSFA